MSIDAYDTFIRDLERWERMNGILLQNRDRMEARLRYLRRRGDDWEPLKKRLSAIPVKVELPLAVYLYRLKSEGADSK